MEDPLHSRAIANLGKLRGAALARNEHYIANLIGRDEETLKAEESTAKEKLQAVISVCGGLLRGEWDRQLEGAGGLEYLSFFEIPAELYEYCVTLPLDADLRSFAEQQISSYRHALDYHRARLSP